MADRRSVTVVLGAQTGGLVNGFRTAKGAVEDFNKSAVSGFNRNRQSLDEIAGASLKVGAGLTAAAGFAVKTAVDWEQAWTGVLKTVDGTGPQLARLEGDLRSLAKETGFAHAEVAAVAEAAGQLGISTEGISDFTETMLAMGVSTNLSSEEAATGLARFRNIMGSTEADISRMGATIVGLGNNFATTEAEILAMSMRLAGASRQIGLSEAQVMGLAASMSSVGIEAEAGGTAMSLTMKRIEKEVDSSGAMLQTFADVAGMSAEQFSTKWKDDAAGALTDFVTGLSTVSERGKSANAVLSELGITGIREADALLRLSGNAEGLAESLDVAAEGWEQNVALMAEAEKFYGTTAQKGKQAWASIKDSAIDAGDTLLPVVAQVFDGVAGLADAFGSLPDPVKGGLAAVAATSGVALLAVGGLIKLTGAVLDAKAAYDALALSGGKAGTFVGATGRVAAGVAALAAVQGAGEALTKRSPKELDELGESLLRFAEKGKLSGDLAKTFGEDFGGVSVRLQRDVNSLGESLGKYENWADDNALTRLTRRFTRIGSVDGSPGYIYAQAEAFKDIDATLSKMAKNRPDDAIKAFEAIRDRALETGGSVKELERRFPIMTELLRSSSEAIGGTSDAAEVLNSDLTELAPAAQEASEELQKAREEATKLGESFFDVGDAFEGSISAWSGQLTKQTEDLAKFRENARTALMKGADESLVDYLISQGPAAAGMLDQLANGSEAAAQGISEAWRGSREELAKFVAWRAELDDWTIVAEFKTAGADDAIETAARVAEEYNLTPEEVETVMTLLDYSSEEIEAVLALMAQADGARANPQVNVWTNNAIGILSTITGQMSFLAGMGPVNLAVNAIHTITSRNATAQANGGVLSPRARAFADGGIDEYGRRVQRVPQIRAGQQGVVMWGEPETHWEAYVSGKPGMRERNKGVATEAVARLGGHVTWYANGGFVDAVSPADLTRLRVRVRDLEADLRKGGDERLHGLDRTLASQELAEARAELRAAERANRSIWGKRHTADTWNAARSVAADFSHRTSMEFTSPASVERQLERMVAESGQFVIALADLKRKGASPWLLEELRKAGPSRSSIRTARQLAQDTGRLRRLNAMASQLGQISGLYGQMTEDPRFMESAAWGALTGAHQQVIERVLKVEVTTSDPSAQAREVRRHIQEEATAWAQSAGI